MDTPGQKLATDQPSSDVHIYRIAARNKIVMVISGAMLFCMGGWSCASLFVSHLRARLAHQGVDITANLVATVVLFVFAILFMPWPFQTRVTIMKEQVEITNGYISHIIPFADILGRRAGGGKGGSGIYLYRRSKSPVWVPESNFQLDAYYQRWRDSIYDLDKADRLKRKATGKEHMIDWFYTDNEEQHPAIGGPI
jgi:hypothetical protein